MGNLLLYVITVFIWGSTWLVIKFQLGQVAPILSVSYRFLIAGTILFTFCLIRRKNLKYSRRDHFFFIAQGTTIFFGSYSLVYIASQYLTSGLVSLVFSNVLIMNIINLRIFMKQPFRGRAVIGGAFGLVGLCLIFWQDIITFRMNSSVYGLLIALVGVYCASLGNVIAARNAREKIPVTQSNAFAMTYGGLVTMAVFLIPMGGHLHMSWTAGYILPVLYLAIMGSVAAFGCFMTLIGRIGADLASYVTMLCPVFALFLSTLYEGYIWTPAAVAGAILALIGNVAVLTPSATLRRLAFFMPSAKAGRVR